jgi:hypothetical protein
MPPPQPPSGYQRHALAPGSPTRRAAPDEDTMTGIYARLSADLPWPSSPRSPVPRHGSLSAGPSGGALQHRGPGRLQ